MADPFADPDDVAARWRPLTDAERSTAATLVLDASAVIRARFPGIDAQVTTGAVDADVLTMIAANMVKRALVAPDTGVTQESHTTGPFAHSQTFANPLQKVFLLADELLLIIGYQPGAGSHRYGNDTTKCGRDGYFSTVYSNGF